MAFLISYPLLCSLYCFQRRLRIRRRVCFRFRRHLRFRRRLRFRFRRLPIPAQERYTELILLLSDPSRFRYALLCKREEGAEYLQAQCVSGECSSCGGLQRVLHIFCDIKEQVLVVPRISIFRN